MRSLVVLVALALPVPAQESLFPPDRIRECPVRLALARPVSAQQSLFQESFENGLAGWAATGLWNAESATDTCGATQTPFPDGSGVTYYGIDGACDYQTTGSSNSGAISWNGWVDLPVGAASIAVRFWSRSETEHCWQNWDVHRVFLLFETGGSVPLQYCDGAQTLFDEPWHERRFDITQWGGQRVSLRFAFDSVDSGKNWLFGWMLDDVSIEVEPGVRVCPGAGLISGCPCTVSATPPFFQAPPVAGGCRNSTNQSAALRSGGLPSLSGDTLTLRAEHMPPNAWSVSGDTLTLRAEHRQPNAWSISGDTLTLRAEHRQPNAWSILSRSGSRLPSVVFGDGIRCADGAIHRLGQQPATNGVATWPLPTESISLRGLVPAAGGTRRYHVHYRDVVNYCTSATFNVTDTQRIIGMP